MIRKAYVLTVLACVFIIVGISAPVFSDEIKTFDALYAALPGQGKIDQSQEIESALKSVVNLQKLREGRIVTIEQPLEVLFYNPRFLSISFKASVKDKLASARAKPAPAVYSLLFESEKSDKLTYQSIFLDWVGPGDVKNYEAVSPEKMSEYFRSKGAEYVFLEKKVQATPPKEMALDGAQIKSGVIDEKFIDADITRDKELQLILDKHTQNVAEQMSKMRPAEQAGDSLRIRQLEERIQKLEALLMSVTRKGNDLFFTNMNVHIQNGTGSESRTNGTGNLVVGYDDPGKGSHNIMIGNKNTCTSYGALVSGQGNVITKKYGVVIGGENNKISGDYAVILGGTKNNASGDYSSILGGSDNKAKGEYSSINGQHGRTKVDKDDNKHFNK